MDGKDVVGYYWLQRHYKMVGTVTWLGIVSFSVPTNRLNVPDFSTVKTQHSGNDMWAEDVASHRIETFLMRVLDSVHQSCRLADLNQVYC